MSVVSTTPITATFSPARRVNQSFTAAAEKRALIFLAEYAPAWVTSDQLTVLGLAAQIAAGILYAASRTYRLALLLVILCIALNWLGDSLDGTLARVRRQQRPRYGFYVDHMVDLFGSIALMTGLGYSGFAHWPVAIALLLAFLVLAGESFLATYTLGWFQLSQGRFGPTEIRIGLILCNLAVLRSPYAHIFGHRLLLFDIGGTIGAAVMFLMAIAITLRHTADLYQQEPLA
jgi:phosphatidylglycerophosphate synthase